MRVGETARRVTLPLEGRAIAYNWNEALMPPSPLRGGIEGGGGNRINSLRITFFCMKSGRDAGFIPPPSIPPLKGEGVVDVELHPYAIALSQGAG